MKSTSYNIDKDGKVTITESVVDPNNPLLKEAEALAQQNPGQIVVGWTAQEDKKEIAHDVDLLDNLSNPERGK